MNDDDGIVSLEAWIMRPPKPRTGLRGFAAMSPEKRKAIAQKGGAAVHPAQRSFSKDRHLASEAGSKGGSARGRPKAPPEET